MVVPVRKVAKPGSDDRKRSIKGSKHKSISPRAKHHHHPSTPIWEVMTEVSHNMFFYYVYFSIELPSLCCNLC